MKKMLRSYLCILALASTPVVASNSSNCFTATPYFSIRSQSEDLARALVGYANDYHIRIFDTCDCYGSFAITLEGTRSFKADRLARCLFGDSLASNCDCPTIRVSGSQVANRLTRDWLADYFGLPVDFASTITVKPRVSQFIADFDLWVGLDCWAQGLYFRVHAPVVYTRWNLRAEECVIDAGLVGYQQGYFDSESIAVADLNKKALNFLSGRKGVANITPLQTSKWALCDGCSDSLTDTKLSDIQFAFGWDFVRCDDYHFGLELRGAGPTGTRPDGEFFFEPVVGNGHHWEAGAGLTSHVILWRDCDCERSFGLYIDAIVTHLFKTRQCRNFDLCNSPNSRYMLAERFNTPVLGGLQGNTTGGAAPLPTVGFTPATSQFKDMYQPVANLTKQQVKVSSGVQGDVVVLFDYTSCGFSWDIGYEFWGRSCEKIDCDCPPTALSGSNSNAGWALKGDASVYGFPMQLDPGGTSALSGGAPVALSATESQSNIYFGTNTPCGTTFDATQRQNPNVDNAQFAYAGTLPLLVQPPLTGPDNLSFDDQLSGQTKTSIQPIFLSCNDINYAGARTRGTSHKFFTNFSYTWCENECWVPFLGIGAKVEWAPGCGNDNCCFDGSCPTTQTCNTVCNVSCSTDCDTACGTSSCNTDCDSCKRCALSEWGVWLKGGVSFH
jgi:hypothetical protein